VPEPKPFRPEPTPAAAFTPDELPTEPEMNDAPLPDSLEPPESLISDKTTDAAASSIGALVRSMTTEKSVAISKSGSVTIEDIVREEIRPLLKAWLDSHLATLVERVVRSEIERVINRSVL
jgi:cell pole-organizing protein PopZ